MPVPSGIEKRVSRHNTQAVCPWNRRFAQPAEERANAAREPRKAAAAGAGAGERLSACIPGTDGPALADLMEMNENKMNENKWDALACGSAIRHADSGGFRRNVAVALGNQ